MRQPDQVSATTDRSDRDLRTRMRLLGVLFLSAALNRTGFIAVFTVTALAAEEILGSARWSGLAAAMGTLGLAAGTTPLAALMACKGRRLGIVVGLTVAVFGAGIAAYGVRNSSFLVLLAGMWIFGFGNSGDRLGRYAAADIAPVSMRSSAIAAIVWAGTIGSVVGPILLPIGTRIVEPFGFREYGGGYLMGGVMAALAAVIVYLALRPDPLQFAEVMDGGTRSESAPLGATLKLPIVRYVISALVVGQVVMVLIMTMTPVHIRGAGESIALVGSVIGVHTFGMFFFSPISGFLADRFGKARVIVAGQAMLIAATLLAAPASGDNRTLLLPALFLLGLGWNFGFVAGSSMITDAAEGPARVRLQGVVDTVTFVSAAAASVLSGILLDTLDYSGLSLFAGSMVLFPLALRYRYRDRLRRL